MLKTGADSRCLPLLVFLLLLTSCGSAIAPSPTIDQGGPGATPAPSFPTAGEWTAPAPTANVTFVLAWQESNDSTIVAALDTISFVCESHTDYSTGVPVTTTSAKVNHWIAPANVTISGNALYLSAYVQYVTPLNTWQYFSMTFSGQINNDGSLSLVSSNIDGVQDYQFTPSTHGAKATEDQYKQACS